MRFPDIHTNFSDALIAVPLLVVLTQIFKIFPIPCKYFPIIATLIGFVISVFFSHRGDLSAGLFMGGFYGTAAVGLYSSLKTAWISHQKTHNKRTRE